MNYPQWTGDEPCRQIDPEVFFPSSFNALRTKDKQLLKAVRQFRLAFDEIQSILTEYEPEEER
jgi:hypothetical protein